MSHARNAVRKHGFTLVELLVVIGIIAVLISVLLPSLNKARRAATSVACASNMRQVGILFMMYATANKGQLPMSMTNNTYYYATAWPSAISYQARMADNGYGAVQNNVKDKSLFLCPAVTPGDFGNVERSYVVSGATYYAGSYGRATVSNTVFGDRSSTSPSNPSLYVTKPLKKVSKMRGSDTIMMMEVSPRNDAWTGANSFAVGGEPWGTLDFYDWVGMKGPWTHDNKSSNYLFVDGHVTSQECPIRYSASLDWFTLYSINNYRFSDQFSVNKKKHNMESGL